MCEIIVISIVVVLTLLMVACYLRGYVRGQRCKQGMAVLLGNPTSRLDQAFANNAPVLGIQGGDYSEYLSNPDGGTPYAADAAALAAGSTVTSAAPSVVASMPSGPSLGNVNIPLGGTSAVSSADVMGGAVQQTATSVDNAVNSTAAQTQMQMNPAMMCGSGVNPAADCIQWNTGPGNWVITGQPSVLWYPGVFVKNL